MKKITSLLVSAIIAFGIAVFASCSNGSGDGSNSSTGGVAFVNELSFASPRVDGKIFSFNDETGTRRYLKFQGGKGYVSNTLNDAYWYDLTKKAKYIVEYNGKMWISDGKFIRESGIGLYAKWISPYGDAIITIKSNGTFEAIADGEYGSGIYNNYGGVLVLTHNGSEFGRALYDGIALHSVLYKTPLIFERTIQ